MPTESDFRNIRRNGHRRRNSEYYEIWAGQREADKYWYCKGCKQTRHERNFETLGGLCDACKREIQEDIEL